MSRNKRRVSILLVAILSLFLISCGKTTQAMNTNSVGSKIENKQTETEQSKKKGWTQEKSNWYYYDNNGKIKTGWIKDNNKSYFLNSSGIMQKGWVKDSEQWYYLDSDGTMATNKTVDGYYLRSNGVMQEKSISTSSTNTNSNVKSSSNQTSKQYVDSNGQGLIKGSKNNIYHIPGSTYYSRTTNVVKWFKTVEEAQASGYRAPEK